MDWASDRTAISACNCKYVTYTALLLILLQLYYHFYGALNYRFSVLNLSHTTSKIWTVAMFITVDSQAYTIFHTQLINMIIFYRNTEFRTPSSNDSLEVAVIPIIKRQLRTAVMWLFYNLQEYYLNEMRLDPVFWSPRVLPQAISGLRYAVVPAIPQARVYVMLSLVAGNFNGV
jgi:hypothetical protein